MTRSTAAVLAALTLLPMSAEALSEWGATATTSAANCPSFCTSFVFGASTGGPNENAAFSSVSDARGNAMASAALDEGSGISTPLLQAEAYSSSASVGSAFGTAFAVEGYTYLGGGTGEFTLDITLDGSVSDPTPADGDTDIVAEVYLFAEENFAFFSDIGTLVFEFGATVIDDTTLVLTSDGSLSSSVSISLAPGESFYLWARLRASAERDLSFADAFSTLTTSFEDATGLVAASVPEPSSLLLGFGVFAALGLSRPRRRGGA